LCDPCHSEEHGKRESDSEIDDLTERMEKAHQRGDWDLMMKLATLAQQMIESGAFYKGLV
jgi:hypothetical protein